jgi:hypothetical protein
VPEKAPLWRPLATIAAGYVVWLVRQSPEQLRARWWAVYPLLAVLCASAAVGAWAVQRWQGRRWPLLVELLVVFGLLIGTAILIRSVLPLLLG